MNAIENGKNKKADFDLLFRLHEKYDVSLDYLFGYETEYVNYENQATSKYTGLSGEAIEQLHFWSKCRDEKMPELPDNITDTDYKDYINHLNLINESKWILDTASKLFEKKYEKDEKDGIADLSILYDIYMLSLDTPETVMGISEEIANSKMPLLEKAANGIRIAANSIFYSDGMNEVHKIDIAEINKQIWKDRLIKDIDMFIESIREDKIEQKPKV